MPDTGAPWNIPYVESTDLVSDWPADSLALANAIDAGLDAAGNAGIGSNAVSAVKTNAFSTTSSSYTGTGLTATITPTSASSKILAIAMATGAASDVTNSGGAGVRIARSGAAMADGDAAGSRARVSGNLSVTEPAGERQLFEATCIWLDSPASTSPVTYEVELKRYGSSTARLNASGNDADDYRRARSISTLVLIEVAA